MNTGRDTEHGEKHEQSQPLTYLFHSSGVFRGVHVIRYTTLGYPKNAGGMQVVRHRGKNL